MRSKSARQRTPTWFRFFAAALFAFGLIASVGLAINLLDPTVAPEDREDVFSAIPRALIPAIGLGAWSWLALRQAWRGRKGLGIAILAGGYLVIGASFLMILLLVLGVAYR